jgi:tetratricopeptide (TPR) repeat protein
MKRRLNVKLLGWLLLVCAFLGVSVHYLHGFQVKRHAGAWLRLAETARQQGNLGLCLDYMNRYLALEPGDTDALIAYGHRLVELSSEPKVRWLAFSVFEQVLNRKQARSDIRKKVVEIAMALGRFADAREHLAILLANLPNDAKVEQLQGWCLESTGDYGGAASWYEKAILHAPGQIASYMHLVDILERRLDQSSRAGQVLDQMVAANDHSVEAWLCRARFSQSHGWVEQATRDIAVARQLAPTEPEVLLAAAQLAQAAGKLDQTRGFLEEGLKVHPHDASLYLTLCDLELQLNRPLAAVGCLRRGLQSLPDHWELLEYLADLLIQQGEVSEARAAIDRLRMPEYSPARLSYWDSRLLMERKQWAEAAPRLERARVDLAGLSTWTKRIDMALGSCYERLGDSDRQLAIYRRLAAQDPACGQARLGLGAALLALGRVGEAMGEYRQMVKLPHVPEGGWTELGRALLIRNLQLPPEEQDWQEIEPVLQQAACQSANSVPVVLLRADILAARHRADEARRLLENACHQEPERIEFWIALARQAEQRGDAGLAERWFGDAERRLGDRLELRKARWQFLIRQGGGKARRVLSEMEQYLERLPTDEQPRLVRELAEAYCHIRDTAAAQKLYRRLAKLQPGDVHCRLVLAELYSQTGNGAGLEQVVAELRRIEGEEGVQWRSVEVSRLLQTTNAEDKQNLHRARLVLGQIARRRPDWARVPLLEASLDELEKKEERAIKSYLRAVELGDRQTPVIHRLAQLLYERRRFSEADRVIRKLEETCPLQGPIVKLAAEVALASQNMPRALELARQAVSAQTRDYRDHLWLGQLLAAAGRSDEAELELRSTVERDGAIPDTWIALVQHLANTRQIEKAKDVIEQARQKLSEDQAAVALAVCYDAIGRSNKAEEQFLSALADQPDDFIVLHKIAQFYLDSRQPGKAQPVLRQMIDPTLAAPQGELAWARRQLALLLVDLREERAYGEAVALIKQNFAEQGELPGDQRTMARVLALQPEKRQEAVRLLEVSRESQPLPPDDQLLLAQLYEAGGDRPRAREQLLALVTANKQSSQYLAYYMRTLLQWGETAEAKRWLAQLETLEPQAPETLAIKAEMMRAKNKDTAPGS